MMKGKSKWKVKKRIVAYLLVLAMAGSVMPEMLVRAEGEETEKTPTEGIIDSGNGNTDVNTGNDNTDVNAGNDGDTGNTGKGDEEGSGKPDTKPTVTIDWVVTEQGPYEYDGKNHVPEVKVKLGKELTNCSAILEIKKEGEVNPVKEAIDVGTYTVTVTGLEGENASNYSLPNDDSIKFKFSIVPQEVTIDWVVTEQGPYEYDGNNHVPEVKVKLGEKELTNCSAKLKIEKEEEVDPVNEAIDVGTYTVTVTGLEGENASNYSLPSESTEGNNLTKSFEISKREVSITWSNTTFDYDGSSHVPTATVTGLCGEDSCTVTVEGEQTNAGKYIATATGLDNSNYTLPKDNSVEFIIKPAEMSGISVKNVEIPYDGTLHGIEEVEIPKGATIKYRKGNEGEYDLDTSPTYIDAGEYTVYYQVTLDNYKDYKGSAKITIICGGHKWNSGAITKSPTDTSAGVYTYTCTNSGCTGKKTVALPQKSITVTLGKSYTIPKNSVYSMSLQSASKHKKYLTFNSKTGKITTKNNSKYYKSLKTATIKVTVGKTSYNMKVKWAIPKSSVEKKLSIKKKSVGKNYKYQFKYNFKNATKIKVRVVEQKNNKKLNKVLDKYVKKPKSKSSSYFTATKKGVKKIGKKGKLTFQITVYYGKNSVTFTKTK